MEKNKKKKIVLFIAVIFLSLIFLTSFTSCTLLGGSRNTNTAAATEPTTFTVKIGNIIKSVSTTGSVDTSQTINYSLQVSGKVLQVLKAGLTFKKGDVLIELDNSDGVTAINDLEDSLQTAEDSLASSKSSLTIAKINYQQALDSNHIANQLADLNTTKSEEAAASTLLSLENANAAADASLNSSKISMENTTAAADTSINSAKIALENATAAADASLKSAQIALNIAQDNYNAAISSPDSTQSAINTASDRLRTAQATYNQAAIAAQNSISSAQDSYNQAIANAQSQADSAGAAYDQAIVSAQSQADSAEAAYNQALNSQSSSYWNNLSSLQSAQLQIKLTQLNISDAELKIKQAERSVENSKQDIEDAKQDLTKYKILAPFDGTVLTSNYNQSEFAQTGTAISIINNSFVIKTDINESDINKIKIGQDVNITLDAIPDQRFHGKVTEKSSISVNISNVITFEITIKPDDSANSSLLYGLSANLTIIEESAQNVLLVPTQSVYKQNGKQYVDVLTTTTEKIDIKNINQYTKQVEVTTGISNYNYIEIKSGLKEGDVIIASSTGTLNQTSTSGTGFTGSTGQQNTSNTENTSQTRNSNTGNFNQTRNSNTESTSQTSTPSAGSNNQQNN